MSIAVSMRSCRIDFTTESTPLAGARSFVPETAAPHPPRLRRVDLSPLRYAARGEVSGQDTEITEPDRKKKGSGSVPDPERHPFRLCVLCVLCGLSGSDPESRSFI